MQSMAREFEIMEQEERRWMASQRGIVWERNGVYVKKARKGYEVFKPSASGTHAELAGTYAISDDAEALRMAMERARALA